MQPANNRETSIRETPRNEQSLQNPQKHIGFNDSKEEKTASRLVLHLYILLGALGFNDSLKEEKTARLRQRVLSCPHVHAFQ